MLSVGDAAPDFMLADADGREVRLSSLPSPIVLYFYRKDHAPACTMEAKGFRDRHATFAAFGAHVVGVSMDDVQTHFSFRHKHRLPFHLLSDQDGRVHDLYDAWRTRLMGRHPLAVKRCTYVIDRDGIIRHAYRRVNPLNHAKLILGDLERLEAQASWGKKRDGPRKTGD